MQILRDPARVDPCVLVLGMFDGVHRGHQRLLMRGGELAAETGLPLTVCTFEPHPLSVLRPDAAPGRLTTLTERASLMALCGADVLCVHTFTRAFADKEPEDFLAWLADVYRPRAVVCGFNYSFGRKGRGRGEMLAAWGEARGIRTVVVPEVVLDGETVSSTRIRRLLRTGDIREASRLLGHAYTLTGRVVDGKHMGRRLGFPTANVSVPRGKALPAFGVYVCCMEALGSVWPSVVNVGRHPTLPDGPVTVEAYALDSALNLYGETVRLTFMSFLRPERVFPDAEALKAQMTRDTAEARDWFARAERAD